MPLHHRLKAIRAKLLQAADAIDWAVAARRRGKYIEFMPNSKQLETAFQHVRQRLLTERHRRGHWVGQLSESALATATSISALAIYQKNAKHPVLENSHVRRMISGGTRWLIAQQNEDGGWGDTVCSHSNISATMLGVAALQLAGQSDDYESSVRRAQRYIDQQGKIDGLRQRYGKDKTFAVPILANCAMAGMVGWREVAALPFEAAVVPQSLYRFLRLPVVSYAIPALVAIGQAKFIADPPRNPLLRLFRRACVKRGLTVLGRMQPDSGGYLEAIPLTSFVVMSLAHSQRADHGVTQAGLRFIANSFRDQANGTGTWPIDTNLATWNTTLAIHALCGPQSRDPEVLHDGLLQWLLDCQYESVHPFTGAAPGGWGWSDLSGAVPDADDTPGALLACKAWPDAGCASLQQLSRILKSARSGTKWLCRLQNRDGGWPTFCRGWGKLPFDRSGNDITAHVLRALLAWQGQLPDQNFVQPIQRGFAFLASNQREDGSWLPLWFGNQDEDGEVNPVYGTSKVLLAYTHALGTGKYWQNRIDTFPVQRGLNWLVASQNVDGGWGGGASFEVGDQSNEAGLGTSSLQETALALEALAVKTDDQSLLESREKGLIWLLKALQRGYLDEKWPIGFYFAKLWYYERLYPLVFAAAALRQYREMDGSQTPESGKTSCWRATENLDAAH